MRRPALLLLGVAAAVLALTAPAAAHSETGILTVEAVPGDGTVTVRARLVYDNDLHPVPGAAVSVSGTGPGGATLADTPLTDVGEGEYELAAGFPAPGAWDLTFTATGPAATATLAVEVSETSATTTAPETTEPPSTTTAPDDGGEDDGDDDSGFPVVPVILGIIVVAGITAAVVVLRKR